MVPVQRRTSSGDFISTQWSAVDFLGTGGVRSAFTDHGTAANQGRTRALFRVAASLFNRAIDRSGIVAINRADHVPAVALKTGGRIVTKPVLDLAVDGDAVVVVHHDQLGQFPGTGQGASLVRDTFHQTAVTRENPGQVVDHIVAFAVELARQQGFSQCKTDSITQTLAQRTRGGFHASGNTHFRVTGSTRMHLTEVAQLVHGQVVAAKVQQSVDQHGTVAV